MALRSSTVPLRAALLVVLMLLAPASSVALAPDAPSAASLAARLLAVAPQDAAPVAWTELVPLADGDASTVIGRLAGLAGVTPAPTMRAAGTPAWLADAPPALAPALAVLAAGVTEAEHHSTLAIAALTPQELRLAFAELPHALALSNAVAAGVASPQERARFADLQRLSARVDAAHVAAAGVALAEAAAAASAMVADAGAVPTAPGICATGAVAFETDDCRVVVGGDGPNVYARHVVLLVDLGGADEYHNTGGGTGDRGLASAAVLVDVGLDDDVYDHKATTTSGVQGGGYGGAALLLDEGGNDTYRVTTGYVPDGTTLIAQGSGAYGVGVLWDRGGGNDSYESPRMAQAVGTAGIGLLLDEGGNDRYLIPYVFDSEGGQGVGCFGGVGALVDRGAGRDSYDATVADMQGFACYGSVGVLWDGGGDDAYVLRHGDGLLGAEPVVQSGWGQGYGEAGGVGVLADFGGDDHYHVTGAVGDSGRHAQGAGLLGGIGILLDAAGDDVRVARADAQGYGHGGLGVLADGGGADRYVAIASCQGWAGASGVGVLVDAGGGADAYECETSPRLGVRADGALWSGGLGGIGIDA